jgi:predicted nucleic acid-binding Zn ribbon protein
MSFRRLGEILPQTLDGMGLLQRVRAERVMRAWPGAARQAAPELAAGAEVVELRGGVLAVRVPEGRLARLLERVTPEIVRALNEAIGEPAVVGLVRVS